MMEDLMLSIIHDHLELQIDQDHHVKDQWRSHSYSRENLLRPHSSIEFLFKQWLQSHKSQDGEFHQTAIKDIWWWKSLSLELENSNPNNNHWRAKQNIKKNELLAVAVPIVFVKDSLKLLGSHNSSHQLLSELAQLMLHYDQMLPHQNVLIDLLATIYPRQPLKERKKKHEIPNKFFLPLKATLKSMKVKKNWSIKEEMYRLLDCIRFNSIGIYQHNEQLCFNERYEKFNMTALYPPLASLFNHSCRPNVNREFLGPIILFRSISDIPEGTSLCISYIEFESLAENWSTRREIIKTNWDFLCNCDQCKKEEKEQYLHNKIQLMEVFGDELRNFLSELPLKDRVLALEEIQSAVEDLSPQNILFDHRLRILTELGVANLQLSCWETSWNIFNECLTLIKDRYGENYSDSSLICFHLQRAYSSAALFQMEASKADAARWYERGMAAMIEVLRLHRLFFGGGYYFAFSRLNYEIKASFLYRNERNHWKAQQNKNYSNESFQPYKESISAIVFQWLRDVSIHRKRIDPVQLIKYSTFNNSKAGAIQLDIVDRSIPKLVSKRKKTLAKKRKRESNVINIASKKRDTAVNKGGDTKRNKSVKAFRESYEQFGSFIKYRRRFLLGPFWSGCGL